MTSPAARALKSAWQKLQEEKGISVQREGAAALGVPEAVLQNAQAGPAVVRLRPEFAAILRELPRLGRLMTIVRNDSFVALPVGTVSDVKLDGTFGQLTGGPIDVSFDVSRWGSAFALYEESGHSVRRIFYFFDDCGDSALRVLLWSRDGQAEFDALVEGYRDPRPGDVPTTPRDKADWRSAAEFPAAHRVEDEAPRHTAALLETLTATETVVDWIVPAGASRARYVGPLRGLRTGHRDGWYDAHYPHFNTRIAAVDTAALACLVENGSPVVGLIDGRGRLMCRLAIAPGNEPCSQAAWTAAVATLFGR